MLAKYGEKNVIFNTLQYPIVVSFCCLKISAHMVLTELLSIWVCACCYGCFDDPFSTNILNNSFWSNLLMNILVTLFDDPIRQPFLMALFNNPFWQPFWSLFLTALFDRRFYDNFLLLFFCNLGWLGLMGLLVDLGSWVELMNYVWVWVALLTNFNAFFH